MIHKLAFTTCIDKGFILGAAGTITSIRKFYTPDEADILLFFDGRDEAFDDFCALYSVEVHRFSDIDAWAAPLLAPPADDTYHYYHPAFSPHPAFPCDGRPDKSAAPFGHVHHLHPLNVKAYCTAYCTNVRQYDRVVHIDADAFILSRIDDLFEPLQGEDAVFGFDDGGDKLAAAEPLLRFAKPDGLPDEAFSFNAGIVLYRNGPIVQRMMLDFMFYIDSCYHYTAFGNDQGLLRALVLKYCTVGGLRFHMGNAINCNPTWNRADRLDFRTDEQAWYNARNGLKQYMWHGAGQQKLWTRKYISESVNAAWEWVGGEFDKPAPVVDGSLVFDTGGTFELGYFDGHTGDRHSYGWVVGLGEGGIITGPHSENEARWSISNGRLIISKEDGFVTCVYDQNSGDELLGLNFGGRRHWMKRVAAGDFWRHVSGSLVLPTIEMIAGLIPPYAVDKRMDILEIGTQYGRTAIGFCALMLKAGLDVHVDTCDIFLPSSDYKTNYSTSEEVQSNIRNAGFSDRITSHTVDVNENLIKRFSPKRFDFVYVDGDHGFKQVVADCITAAGLVKDSGLIIGDDYNLASVQEAVDAIFGKDRVDSKNDQWMITGKDARALARSKP